MRAKIIINTYPEINDSVYGNFVAKVTASFLYQQRKLNLELMNLCQQYKDAFICDIAALQSDLGYRFVFCPKMYVNADLACSLDFFPYIAKHITDITVPDLPEDPAEYMVYLPTLNLFETASVTEEDELRTQQYKVEAERNVLQKSFANESEFLGSRQSPVKATQDLPATK